MINYLPFHRGPLSPSDWSIHIHISISLDDIVEGVLGKRVGSKNLPAQSPRQIKPVRISTWALPCLHIFPCGQATQWTMVVDFRTIRVPSIYLFQLYYCTMYIVRTSK